MTWSSFKNCSPFTSTPKRHIFATEFTRIHIGTCGVYYNILRYSSTHDATDTSNILLRIRTVCPHSNRIPWNTIKHSKRHTPDSFSKKINIDQLRTIMIICHWNILAWPQIFESACDTDTTVTNGLPDAKTPEYSCTSQVFATFANPWLCITLVFCSIQTRTTTNTLCAQEYE